MIHANSQDLPKPHTVVSAITVLEDLISKAIKTFIIDIVTVKCSIIALEEETTDLSSIS